MIEIGSMSAFRTFSPQNHEWAKDMDWNMIRASATLHGSVKAIVSSLPSSPAQGDTYLIASANLIAVYTKVSKASSDAPDVYDWHVMTAVQGVQLYVEAEQSIYILTTFGTWDKVFDLNQHPAPIERNLSFYIPGFIRPNDLLFHYIATMEFTIPAGAPGSFATLETAPVGGSLLFNVIASGGSGTISFAAGSTEGVFSFPANIVVNPAEFETLFSHPGTLSIRSPGNTRDSTGLSISLRGMIRSIDLG